MVVISELALHVQRDGSIWRAVVNTAFARKILEENFNSELMQKFLDTAKKVDTPSGFDRGLLLIDENEKKVFSAQTAFGLEMLENLTESWEYTEAGIYEKIKALKP